mmetsp:Transcript_8107/g.23861  ORF Transcript_8107/g.23861 Transcript_8107/m.23861 type:complete len:203 (-) Transcript_8107:236-844(-)
MTAGGPPLPKTPLGTALNDGSSTIVVELFLDLTCPFSRKMFTTIHDGLKGGTLGGGKAKFVFQNVVQPWHAQSTIVHEAALAVKRVAPEKFVGFCRAVYDSFDAFTSTSVQPETREQTGNRLAALAESACGVPASDVQALLKLTGEGNAGCAVTQEVKWYVKHHRARGVHVTPTVFVNGIEAPQAGSAWTAEQWSSLLDELS